MATCQRGFDLRLAFEQPVQRRVELVLVHRPQTEYFAQAAGGGDRVEGLGGGQFR